ncbi:hypothetical protein [Geomicrobium sp. JCM 19038]|uniref:hypothetical protein n=1 Tax=Geomicrobium sp. JCM 19038 TaxID=1460635 RepID=UPI00045F437A|nr:hypothetical protein [Geomicrobium sp. JCM 19038]GAK09840.1 hypothetical protein JCM19038_3711 [Geomicrobium sp. JCM 19038]
MESIALTTKHPYTNFNMKRVIPKGSSIKAAVVITGEILGTAGNDVVACETFVHPTVGKGLFLYSFAAIRKGACSMSKLMKLLKSKAVRQGIKEAQKHVVPFVKKELAKRKGTKKR